MFCGSGVDDSGSGFDDSSSCDIGLVALPLYWYGQLVGNQPLAVYLYVYVWVYLCVHSHDPILLGAWWMADYEMQSGLICICGMERYIINYTS